MKPAKPSYQEWRQSLLKRNSKFAKKGWKITTFKTAQEEEQFQHWVHQNKVPFNSNDPYPDYDMRGFYQALQNKDPKATSAVNPYDNRIHYPDYWKTPYHESFSNESQWATKDAPSWQGNDKIGYKLMDKAGNVYKDESLPQGQQ